MEAKANRTTKILFRQRQRHQWAKRDGDAEGIGNTQGNGKEDYRPVCEDAEGKRQ